jgi:uncharacterized membrane protein
MTRRILRLLLGLLYFAAGVLHLALPAPFLKITPGWVPDAPLVIALTGLAELAGSVALVQGGAPPCAGRPGGPWRPMRSACGRPISTTC